MVVWKLIKKCFEKVCNQGFNLHLSRWKKIIAVASLNPFDGTWFLSKTNQCNVMLKLWCFNRGVFSLKLWNELVLNSLTLNSPPARPLSFYCLCFILPLQNNLSSHSPSQLKISPNDGPTLLSAEKEKLNIILTLDWCCSLDMCRVHIALTSFTPINNLYRE
jgi:hypothetical protein